MRVFLTGATGFLGGELLVALARHPAVEQIVCLVRAKDCAEAQRRLDQMFAFRSDTLGRAKVVAIGANLADPALAQHLQTNAALGAVDTVIHAAADTSFSPHRDGAVMQANIEGTRRIIEWARRLPRLGLFVYVGTAASCGIDSIRRVVHEDESPNPDARHAVTYSYTKMIGEMLVRGAFPAEQALVVRPSIVMGDARGWAPRSDVILWAFQAMRQMRLVPVNGAVPVDIVAVDYVVEALLALLFGLRRHTTYHISAGSAGATSGLQLFESVAEDPPALPEERFVDRSFIPQIRAWTRGQLAPGAALYEFPAYLRYWEERFPRRGDLRLLLAALLPYFRFVELGQLFDNTRLLADTSIGAPEPAHSYLRRGKRYLQQIDVLRGARDP